MMNDALLHIRIAGLGKEYVVPLRILGLNLYRELVEVTSIGQENRYFQVGRLFLECFGLSPRVEETCLAEVSELASLPTGVTASLRCHLSVQAVKMLTMTVLEDTDSVSLYVFAVESTTF